jgi:hypothetical protein
MTPEEATADAEAAADKAAEAPTAAETASLESPKDEGGVEPTESKADEAAAEETPEASA